MSNTSGPSGGPGPDSGSQSGYQMHVSAMHDMAHREGLNRDFPPPAWDGHRTRFIGYVLWLFVGWLGGHRFYVGRWRSGLVMLSVGLVTSLATAFFGPWPGVPMTIWWVVDALLIPGWVRKANEDNDARRETVETV